MDTFEAMLAPTVQRTAPRKLQPHEKAMLAHDGYLANDPRVPYRAPPNNAPVKPVGAPKATLESEMAAIVSTIRPDYADDIDAMVATLVSSGDVVLDTETDMYRRPHYRRYRFGDVS